MPSEKIKTDHQASGRTRAEGDRQGIQVLSRAVAILRAVSNDTDGLSLGKIALHVGLPRSTVQRIVNALLADDLLAVGPNGTGYRIGSAVQQLAESARQDVPKSLHSLLESLSEATGETLDLAMCRDEKMVFIDQVAGKQRLRTISAIGETFPMAVTANGKAVLALKTEDNANRICKREREQGVAVKSATAMKKELALIRRQGFGLDVDEHTPGVSAVGIAFKSNGNYYAISMPAPSHRFVANQKIFIAKLLEAREEIVRSITDVEFS